jgi:hypothetical protein
MNNFSRRLKALRFKPLNQEKKSKHAAPKEDHYVMAESPEFYAMLRDAEACLRRSNREGYVSKQMMGTYILRCGQSTVQLWEQQDDTHGQDQHYWMQTRGPAFEAEEFPVESYRLTSRRLREAVTRMSQ